VTDKYMGAVPFARTLDSGDTTTYQDPEAKRQVRLRTGSGANSPRLFTGVLAEQHMGFKITIISREMYQPRRYLTYTSTVLGAVAGNFCSLFVSLKSSAQGVMHLTFF
jgi:hypothetical protein